MSRLNWSLFSILILIAASSSQAVERYEGQVEKAFGQKFKDQNKVCVIEVTRRDSEQINFDLTIGDQSQSWEMSSKHVDLVYRLFYNYQGSQASLPIPNTSMISKEVAELSISDDTNEIKLDLQNIVRDTKSIYTEKANERCRAYRK